MDVLARGAISWARKSEAPSESAMQTTTIDEELMRTYADRLANGRTTPSPHTPVRFAQLVGELGLTLPSPSSSPSRVIEVAGATVRFRPLLVEPGMHVAAQAECFAVLVDYWRRCGGSVRSIERLEIDLSAATMRRVRECMSGVSVGDVTRGIWIWETFPCRIEQIVVRQPTRMPHVASLMRRLMWLCLSQKVISKIRFMQEPPNGDDDGEHTNAATTNDGAHAERVNGTPGQDTQTST